jgi:hypothetical protein
MGIHWITVLPSVRTVLMCYRDTPPLERYRGLVLEVKYENYLIKYKNYSN